MVRKRALPLLLATVLLRAARAGAQEPPPVGPVDPVDPPPVPPELPNAESAVPPPATPTPESAVPPHALDPTPPLGLLPTSQDALVDPRMARSWGMAPARWFASTLVDVGFVYVRPRLSLGYGRPFTSWIGVDLNPIANSGGLGAYGGLRVEVPFFDIRVGSRYWFPFNHSYLDPLPTYDRLALERDFGTRSTQLVHEAELDVALPAGPGNVVLRGNVSYVTGVPDGQLVYEQGLRVIVAPPWVWRARAGYALRLGKYHQHSIGLVSDLLGVPERNESPLTFRLGPVLRIVLSRRVEVRGSFVTTISSPDKIGLAGGDFTELGVRYRWATEP